MKKVLLFLLLLGVVLAAVLRIRYGGGEAFVARISTPLLDASSVELVLSYPEPIGNVAVNRDGRLFFTVHPESRPRGNKLLEYVEGAAVPYPDNAMQQQLFDTVLGVVVDADNRLWTIDHGNHGLRVPRIVGIDLETDEVLRNQPLDESIAPKGSFLQDLQVSRDGKTIVIADASFWRKRPAIVVYDVKTGEARRVLEGDVSVSGEHYTITSEGRRMSFMGGLLSLRGGIDGIALDDEWLYYGALSGASLYRVKLADLRDTTLPDAQLAARVERVSDKPLSDGMSIDLDGQVYLTDVENNALFVVDQDKRLRTLVQDERIRWPDALSFGPDGWLYVADSALSEVVFRPQEHMEANQPYSIFRLRPGAEGIPGQ
ncbi:MAG: L-dopachrome tautomerase-related protein [Woeseiaceae bacterium]|nr:L-dopachrome tautomerase-related protein [Woeseiaceae bacterium]